MQKDHKKALTTEANIELRAKLPRENLSDKFDDIYLRVKDRFPQKSPFRERQILFDPDRLDSDEFPFIERKLQRPQGFWFKSEDQSQAIKVISEGFSLNQVAPYEAWEKLTSEAKNLWEIYKEICKPLSVTRVGSRTVYQLDIPADDQGIELKDYLTTVPEVSPNLPQKSVKNFFMQVEIPQEDLDCTLFINEAIVPPASPEVITVVFDINLFRRQVWDSNDEDIWHFLEKLSHRKHEIFEAIITERTKELIS